MTVAVTAFLVGFIASSIAYRLGVRDGRRALDRELCAYMDELGLPKARPRTNPVTRPPRAPSVS